MPPNKSLQDCPACGYDLRGLPTDHRCPECGVAYGVDADYFKVQRFVVFRVGVVVACLAVVIWELDRQSSPSWVLPGLRILIEAGVAAVILFLVQPRSFINVSPHGLTFKEPFRSAETYRWPELSLSPQSDDVHSVRDGEYRELILPMRHLGRKNRTRLSQRMYQLWERSTLAEREKQ